MILLELRWKGEEEVARNSIFFNLYYGVVEFTGKKEIRAWILVSDWSPARSILRGFWLAGNTGSLERKSRSWCHCSLNNETTGFLIPGTPCACSVSGYLPPPLCHHLGCPIWKFSFFSFFLFFFQRTSLVPSFKGKGFLFQSRRISHLTLSHRTPPSPPQKILWLEWEKWIGEFIEKNVNFLAPTLQTLFSLSLSAKKSPRDTPVLLPCHLSLVPFCFLWFPWISWSFYSGISSFQFLPGQCPATQKENHHPTSPIKSSCLVA